nr:Abi-alpha family protein [Amycolatopsis nigrescens]
MSPQDRLLDSGAEDSAGNDGLARRAGRLVGWAARTGYSLSKRIPGAEAAERGLRQVEKQVLGELRRRLDEVDDPYLAALTSQSHDNDSGTSTAGSALVVGEVEPLRAAMAELLNRSVEFTRERAREYLYALILRQLTPDEARILAALADGSPYPVIDVAERSGLGVGQVVLRNASTVGKAAGVTLVEHTPGYLTRLIGFGLADLGDELPGLETQYEILLTDETVRAAESTVKRAKFLRGSVRLSRLGAQFWLACDPTG